MNCRSSDFVTFNNLNCFGLLVKRFALHSRLSRLAGRSERRAHPGPPADALTRDATREVAVTFKSPEEELQELLAQYPPWVERILWKNPSPTNLRPYKGLLEKYEGLLQRIPKKWREYRQAKKLYAQRVLGPPPGQAGRPRKDALAEEAQQLKSGGKSYAQVARALNNRHGEGTTTAEAVRKLLVSRKKEQSTTPDKT